MSSSTQIPYMHLMSVFAAKKQIRLNSVLNHLRRSPFATQQRVKPEVPPKIVMQKLRVTVDFPLPEHFKRFAVEHENPARTVAVGIPECANVNSFRTTVNGMRTRIIRAGENYLRLDHFDDLWFPRIWLGIDDVNPRGTDPG